MARRKKRLHWGLIITLSLVICACLAITFGSKFDLPFSIPTWSDIGSHLGIKPKTVEGEQPVTIHFIDVGQGDSTLIKAYDKNILIDAGENDKGDLVVNYLKQQGVEKLDVLVSTHPHSDHIGGLDVVVKEMDVGKILAPKIPEAILPTTRSYTDFLQAVVDKGMKIQSPKPGDVIDFGHSKLEVVGPTAEFDDLNNISLVMKFVVGDVSVLLTGDAEKDSESDMLLKKADLKANILKVGHHGSNTSSTKKFIQAVGATDYVICCGRENSYHHPHAKTLETIKKFNGKVYRTDLNGTIVYSTDGKSFSVKTQL